MILRALYDYYDRSRDVLAPLNLSYEEVAFAIVINENGDFLRIEDLRNEEGVGTEILTLRPEERTSSPIPHFLGDNGSYVLGLKNVKVKEKFDYQKEYKANKKNHEAFVEYVNVLSHETPQHILLSALVKFYQSDLCKLFMDLHSTPIWAEVSKNLGKNFTFKLEGSNDLALTEKCLYEKILAQRRNENLPSICLVTGNKDKPVSNTYSTFIIGGKSNGKLVSFQVSSGYDSYGKEKCLNAPISEEAEFKYTTALLYMLRKGSHNKFNIGNRTFLFWASSNSEAAKAAESSLYAFFGKGEDDNPNKRIELVRQTFMSIYNGKLPSDNKDNFYILGLAPNSARIAVVYWAEIPLRNFAGTINQHFLDMEITDTRKEKKPYVGLHSILGAVTREGKSSEVTPNLPDAVVKSVFQGIPYPESLYQACIRRIKAEQSLTIARAAIIKAYLNRKNNNSKINVMLDKENKNQGYLCGRLFAVLDKIQEDANGIHSIRERYMNSASSTPSAVFATILNLSSHHLEKLNAGSQVYYEKLKQEIIDKLEAIGFPAHLDLQDQGRFFVGYYHQRQDLFKSKEEKQQNN